jgi:hypothetical protein
MAANRDEVLGAARRAVFRWYSGNKCIDRAEAGPAERVCIVVCAGSRHCNNAIVRGRRRK